MIRASTRPLVFAAILAVASPSYAQGVWPEDPWTDLRVVSVTSSQQNGRNVILDDDVLHSFGTRNRTPGGDNADGFLQIYDRATRGWVARPRMLNPGFVTSPNFGLAADIRNDLIAVGAPDDQLSPVPGENFPAPFRYGYVRLMRIAPDGQSWSPEQLIANTESGRPFFGFAVRFLSDDLLAIGSPREDINNGDASGAVHLYRFDGVEWARTQTLTVDPSEGRVFGWRIEFASGDLLIAAAGDAGFNAAVYVFRENDDGQWSQAQRIAWTDADPAARFDADNDVMILGAPNATTPLGHTGETRVYRRINGVWTHEATILPEATDFDPRGSSFGNNVAVDDGAVVASTFASSGVIQVFERNDANWTFAAQVRPPKTTISFANALDFADGRVAIGDPGANIFGSGSGGAFLFTRDAECFQDLRGDANNDGVTDFDDLNAVLVSFGLSGDELPGDVTNDGTVDMTDLNVVLSLFGSPCLPPI